MENKNIWKVFNERTCFTSGYSIYQSPLYSDLRFYHKDDWILGVVNKVYFKGNVNNWLEKDILEDIIPCCHFFYIYTVGDSVKRIDEIFKTYLESFSGTKNGKYAFIECPFCMRLAILGKNTPNCVNNLTMGNSRCINCLEQNASLSFQGGLEQMAPIEW